MNCEISKATGLRAIVRAQRMKNEYHAQMCEILACVQYCINSVAVNELRQLVQNGLECYDKQEVGMAARQDLRTIGKAIEQYEKMQLKTLSEAVRRDHQNPKTKEEYELMTADMLDDSDDQLTRHLNDLDAAIDAKMPKGGHACPRDPWLLKQLIRCTVLTACTVSFYESAERYDDMWKQTQQLKYCKLTRIQTMLDQLYRHITPLNKYGQPMLVDDGWLRWKNRENWQEIYKERPVFNARGILFSEQINGKVCARGTYEGGVLPNIRNTLFSTRFIDRLFILRDGIDPHYRTKCDSILTGLRGDNAVEIPPKA